MAEALVETTRPRRIADGVLALAAGQIILAIGQLLLVPVYLTRWSSVQFGEWLALSSAVSYLATLDLGMQMAAVNRLTQAYAVGDYVAYRQVQSAMLTFYGVLVLVGSVAVAVAAWWLPVPALLGLRTITSREAAAVMLLLALYVLFSMPTGLVAATYRTTGALAASQWVGNLQRLCTMAFIGGVLCGGGGMIAVAMVQVVVLLATTLAIWIHLWRSRPELVSTPSEGCWTAWRPLALPALMFFVIMVANAISLQAPLLIVSSTLGGAAVTIFTIVRMLGGLVRQAVGVLNAAIWPDLTILDQRREYSQLRQGHSVLLAVSSTSGAILVGMLWIIGNDVLRLWTRGVIEVDATLLRVLLLGVLLQTPWLASSVFLAAANRNRGLGASYLASAVIGVVIGTLLLPRFGLTGMAVGLLAGDAVACYHFVIRDTCRLLGEDYAGLAWRTWSRLALVTGGIVLVGSAAAYVAGDGFLARASLVGGACAVTGAALSWKLWFRRDERATIRRSVDSILATWRWTRVPTTTP